MLISSSSGTQAVPETARGMPSAIPSSESYVQSVQSMGKMSAVGDVETRKLKSTRGAAGVSFLSFRKLSVNDSHDLCLWVLFTVVCQVTSIIRQPETPAMSKASAKTVKGESRFYRLRVPPYPYYITSGDTPSLCMDCLGAKLSLRGSFQQRSSWCWPYFRQDGVAAALVGFAAGLGRGNGDRRVAIFFLTCQICCLLSEIGSRFFSPRSGLRGGWCGERWGFAPSVPPEWGVIGSSHSCGC